MEEVWKQIKGFEGYYEVSNFGNVRSIDRYVYQQGREQLYKGVQISPYKINSGYLCVRLSKGNKKKGYLVHRLVAEAFIQNPQSLPQINHKDENKHNNNIENLEWCTLSYNASYGTLPQKKKEKFGHRVCQYDNRGSFLRTFTSSREAERETNIRHSEILDCCKHLAHTAGGYIWRFKKETNENPVDPVTYKTAPRSVSQYDKDMNLVATYKSICQAAKENDLKAENIGACCRGKSVTLKGYYWAFSDAPKPTKKNFCPINKYTLKMELIATYDTLTEAADSIGGKSKKAGIKQCLYGKNKFAYGYIWRYANN